MPIRTLYIGLGGAGAKSILRTKKCFVDAYGEAPLMVAFLAIDTDHAIEQLEFESRKGDVVKFDINGMLYRTGLVAAYFYNSNGNALRNTNSSYRTTDGNVATHVNFTPNYENCTFNDLSIFMPYSELHLSRTTSCYFTVSIWNGNNEVAQSERNSFHLTY